jgi:polysaccharide biosynthesis protein PslG
VPRPRAVLVPLALAAICAGSPAAAGARVPAGFVGVMADGPLLGTHVDLGTQLDKMVGSGVESVRVVFNWALAEPYASWKVVPPPKRTKFVSVQGVPISFAVTDRIVGAAAQRGLSILPVLLDTPSWAAAHLRFAAYNVPKSDSTYARIAGIFAGRYGPSGSFWRANPLIPKLAIRMWQIWNEPNLDLYWPTQPFATSYMALVRAARTAIKRADAGAKIVLAGMPNVVWDEVASIYAVPGARQLFDVVAVHPFTAQPAGVITILQRVRTVMDQNGDATKPMVVTETSWPSSLGKTSQSYPWNTTESGQASNTAAIVSLLAANRSSLHLIGFYDYTWLSQEKPIASFSFSGLLRFSGNQVTAKPALAAFRRAALKVEGCRIKASVATRCLRP